MFVFNLELLGKQEIFLNRTLCKGHIAVTGLFHAKSCACEEMVSHPCDRLS